MWITIELPIIGTHFAAKSTYTQPDPLTLQVVVLLAIKIVVVEPARKNHIRRRAESGSEARVATC